MQLFPARIVRLFAKSVLCLWLHVTTHSPAGGRRFLGSAGWIPGGAPPPPTVCVCFLEAGGAGGSALLCSSLLFSPLLGFPLPLSRGRSLSSPLLFRFQACVLLLWSFYTVFCSFVGVMFSPILKGVVYACYFVFVLSSLCLSCQSTLLTLDESGAVACLSVW